jgi:cytochrome c-type biogenesis protein CcmH
VTARLALLLWLLLAGSALAAVMPDEMLPDPAQEARARTLSHELRCLVCQNESIDDSNADLAADLRRLVRQRIAAGDSDEQVKRYLVARYGEFVLLKPPVEPATYLLWFGPLAVLLLGGGLLAAYYRSRRRDPERPADLSPEERARLERLLAEERLLAGTEGGPS